MITLTLYHRIGCHLCDDMRDALREWQRDLHFEVREIDIDREPALVERHGKWIPVLTLGDREVCHYFLDTAALEAALSSVREAG